MGADLTPEGANGFQKCCDFFEQKVEQTEELGDSEAHDIDEFISKYENSAQITQILWQLYYLKLELESENGQIEEIQQ